MQNNSDRIYYMDNLRALAMLLGIFFHASIAYNPMMANLWLSADTQHSELLQQIAWFTHLFRMPVFFLIAGFFAMMLLEKRGIKGFLVHRFKRIGLPFIIFYPVLMISVIMLVGWAMSAIEPMTPMLSFFKMMSEMPNAEQPPMSTMHLWFLFNLMLFCLVIGLMVRMNWHRASLFSWLLKPVSLILILPLIMVPALATQWAPHPAAERFYPELWSFGFYGVFFFIGLLIFQKQSILEELKPYALPLLIVSIGQYFILYQYMPKTIVLEDLALMMAGPELTIEHLLVAVLEAYIAVFMTIVCLVYGARFLNSRNKVLRYIADGSYWVYIIHLPIIFLIQFHLIEVELGAWTEFWIVSILTLIIGFLSYALLIRWTPVGTLLNGKRVPFLK